jgi:hypothetical protein
MSNFNTKDIKDIDAEISKLTEFMKFDRKYVTEENIQKLKDLEFEAKYRKEFQPKGIHGTYIKEPKCKICNVDLTHEWLGGDYTLLICENKQCWDELNKQKK